MARFLIPDELAQSLETRLDQLQRGEIQLQDLPFAVSAWFHAGEAAGRQDRQPEVDRLNHQLDVYWARAFLTNDQRRERILQRLHNGLQEADEATWDRIEQQLSQAIARRPEEATEVAAEENQIDHTRRSRTETLTHQSQRHSERAA